MAWTLPFGSDYIIKLRSEGEEPPSGYEIVKRYGPYLLVRMPLEGLRHLSTHPSVEYVVPDVELRAFRVPNDPKYQDQWGLPMVRAEKAWDLNTECQTVVVAILDTGVDYDHVDLKDNLWRNEAECSGRQGVDDDNNGYKDDCYGYDFVNDDGDPMDDNGHGTAVAGIVGAVGNNSEGVAGICWRAKIMAVKILGADGSGTTLGLVAGVKYAVDNGAKVINLSLGTCPAGWGGCPDQIDTTAFRDAIEYALRRGVMIIAAAGNEGVNTDTYPVYPASLTGDYTNLISVASVDSDGSLSSFSNYGEKTVDVGAPGGFDADGRSVLTTSLGNTYSYFAGTSIATAFVAGEVAMIRALYPNMDIPSIEATVLTNVTSVQSLSGKVRSGGYIDLYGSVSGAVRDPQATEPSRSRGGGGGGGCSTGSVQTLIILVLLLLRPLIRKVLSVSVVTPNKDPKGYQEYNRDQGHA